MDNRTLALELAGEVWMRPIKETDTTAILELVRTNYDHLRTFMEWAKPDYGRRDAEEWIARSIVGDRDGSQLNFGIFRATTLIGTIGFAAFDHGAKVTEIGYWIDASEQGKGIVSRATEKLLELAFERLGMNRVQIRCASGNLRSAAIPEKLGFKKEGVQRQHVMRDGKIYDFLIFGLLREEWLSRPNA
ncbi:MAG: GNAT family N-acetyltransferase [Pyrinomonadaceae bacterium]